MRTKTQPIQINALKSMALTNSKLFLDNPTTLEQDDITPLFWQEISRTIKAGELCNIQITGEVIGGKSTLMAKIVNHGNNLLNIETSLKHLCADQVEFSRLIKRPETKQCFVGIDEYNYLASVGLNSSVEESFFKYYSSVCAQVFVHRVSCSPTGVIDPNATILLEILGKDTDKEITRAIVKYRVLTTTENIHQTIGHVDIYVGDILKKSWYKKYRKRKFQKIRLVLQEAVKDIRELEFAELILSVYEKLRKMAEIGLVNRNLITTFVDTQRRKSGQFHSILTTEDLTNKIAGLLKLVKEQARIQNEIEKGIKTINNPKTNIFKKKETKDKIAELNQILQELQTKEKEITNEYKKLIQINKQYQEI